MSKLKKELNEVGESFLNIGYYLSELSKVDTYKNINDVLFLLKKEVYIEKKDLNLILIFVKMNLVYLDPM